MKYLEKNQLIELDNNKKYVVVDSIIYKDNNYAYLISSENPKDQVFALVTEEDNKTKIDIIDNKAEENKKIIAELAFEVLNNAPANMEEIGVM